MVRRCAAKIRMSALRQSWRPALRKAFERTIRERCEDFQGRGAGDSPSRLQMDRAASLRFLASLPQRDGLGRRDLQGAFRGHTVPGFAHHPALPGGQEAAEELKRDPAISAISWRATGKAISTSASVSWPDWGVRRKRAAAPRCFPVWGKSSVTRDWSSPRRAPRVRQGPRQPPEGRQGGEQALVRLRPSVLPGDDPARRSRRDPEKGRPLRGHRPDAPSPRRSWRARPGTGAQGGRGSRRSRPAGRC